MRKPLATSPRVLTDDQRETGGQTKVRKGRALGAQASRIQLKAQPQEADEPFQRRSQRGAGGACPGTPL